MTALNPLHTIGDQIAEPLRLHRGASRAAARAEALRLLERVRLPQASAAARRLPASALRRPAPARDDRDRAGLRPDAADRRRADDRARRDDPGRDPRPDRRTGRRERHGAAADQPRPRRDGAHGRAAAGDVRRHAWSSRGRPPACSSASRIRTRAGCSARGRASAARAAPGWRRSPAACPELVDMPAGCPFADRCAWVTVACRAAPPPPVAVAPGHQARCIRLADIGVIAATETA